MRYAELLQGYRKEAGLSQLEVAKKISKKPGTVQAISNAERGIAPLSPKYLKKFCEVCNGDYELVAYYSYIALLDKKKSSLKKKYGLL